jgi:nucleoid-associated protein YgaU
MGTGIKVGMVVVLIVVVGAIFFFVNQGKKAGNTSTVVPMNAPAQRAVPGAARTEPRGKPAEKPLVPVRTSPAGQPAAGERRSIITPPPGRMTSPTAQPIVARPPNTLQPAPTSAPVAGPNTPRLMATPKPAESASHPYTPPPALPPLTVTGEPTSRPATSGEPEAMPLTRITPAVSPPPRQEPEPPAATPLPAQPSPAAAVRKYTVAEGETLWSIAEEQYGDPYLYTKLLAANPGISEFVNAGQVINLPAKDALLAPVAKPSSEAEQRKSPPGGHPYVVVKDDTLYSIAAKQLGNGNRWRELLELNKDKLTRPEDLQVGMELKLPAKEAAPSKNKTEPARPEPKKNGLKKKT